MADVKAVFPILPRPTQEYDPKMMGDLIRALDNLMAVLRHPGEGRHNKLTLTTLPSSDTGLEAGALYALSDGVVRISQLNLGFPDSFTIIMSLGSVTVTIT